MYLFLKRRIKKEDRKKFLGLFLICLLVTLSFVSYLKPARAGGLTSASVRLSDSRPDAAATSVTYTAGWTFPGTATVMKCFTVRFATTATGSTEPTGMNTTSATKAITGTALTNANWTLDSATDGVLKFTYATGATPTEGQTAIVTMGSITNPTSVGNNYAIIKTYDDTSCTDDQTHRIDTVVTVFTVTAGQALSVEVDPSLTFAVAGLANGVAIGNGATTTVNISGAASGTIPMGNVNATTNPIVGQSLTVTTNAENGYTVYASYSGTLEDTNSNTIADHTGTNGSPATFPAAGTSAFGYQSGSTSLSTGGGGATRFSSNKWAKFETWGYEVARSATKASAEATNIGIQVGVSGTQEAGTYSTTITYVATPTY